MKHSVPDFHTPRRYRDEKPGFVNEAGLFQIYDLRLRRLMDGSNQPRVRERIMKLSNVYSATCHHRYWSER